MNRERTELADVVRRNGAYLISLDLNMTTDDYTSDALYDVASSLVKAKRIALMMVEDFSTGPYRWEQFGNKRWCLSGIYIDDRYEAEDEDDG